MLTFCRKIATRPFAFASSVTRDSTDYYKILELQSGATQQAIRKAYTELTQKLRPELDVQQFKNINEAFVILTDNKTRQAYDSLLSVRKSFYLNPQNPKPIMKKSYLSTRKMSREEELKKKINIDEFGRYKGGLPRKNTQARGNSVGETGTMYRQRDVEETLDQNPEFNIITSEKAESFKDFHQDERKARTMKWPWFTFEVDYQYFTFRTFRKKYWPAFQFVVFFFYILPTLFYTMEKLQKKEGQTRLQAKAQKKLTDAETTSKETQL